MRDHFLRVVDLQRSYDSTNTTPMQERGELVRTAIPSELLDRQNELAPALGRFELELEFEGRDGTGRKTRVPWVRAYSRVRSPSAQQGWYCVYLFHADASGVSLCLSHGSTTFDGSSYKARSSKEAQGLMEWGRSVSGHLATSRGFSVGVSLGSNADLVLAYESTTAFSKKYTPANMPSDATLLADLGECLELLTPIYELTSLGRAPGEVPPDIQEASALVASISNPLGAARRTGQGFGLTAAERRVVERHAMSEAERWLVANGHQVKDVSGTKPYDLVATKGSTDHIVEVKGTTGSYGSVLLTHTEVAEQKRAYPRNMLIVVHDVSLSADRKSASGGITSVIAPWPIDDTRLKPLSYQYTP